jgi:hypothetical protein
MNKTVRLTKNGRRLSEAEVQATKLYKENYDWAGKFVREKFAIFDIGGTVDDSLFYEMEKLLLTF